MIGNQVQKKQEIIEVELGKLADWDDKISYIIEKGFAMHEYPIQHKTDEFLIKECQSKAWLFCNYDGNKLSFSAHSETIIVRGIIAIFLEVYQSATADEILNTPISFLENSGMLKLFSNRITGITGIIDKINDYARQYR